jgi:hypothetical protein
MGPRRATPHRGFAPHHEDTADYQRPGRVQLGAIQSLHGASDVGKDISPTACGGLCLCRRAACRIGAQPNAPRSGEAVASQSPQGQHEMKPVLAIGFMDRPPKQAFRVRDPVLQGRVVHG